MKMMQTCRLVCRKLALAGLILSPLVVTPGFAAELVGKPAPINASSQAAVSKAQANQASVAANNASVAANLAKVAANNASAAASSAAKAPAAPVSPDAPHPADAMEPAAPMDPMDPPEPPSPDDFNGAMDDFHNGLEEAFGHGDPDGRLMAMLIPLVAITLLFGGPVILVIVLVWFYYRSKNRRQQAINANIDKLLAAGRDIPVELLMGEDAPIVRTQTTTAGATYTYAADEMMHKGVRNIGLGTGWLLFLTIMFGIKIGSFGFIFIGLGISQVVIWVLSGRRNNTAVRVQE